FFFMKKIQLAIAMASLLLATSQVQAQNYWQAKNPNTVTKVKSHAESIAQNYTVYELQVKAFKNVLSNAPMRGSATPDNGIEIDFPMADGTFQRFKVIEAPVLDETLSAEFPDIKSYAGQGVDHPDEIIRFSIGPLGVKSMLISAHHGFEFIEPYSEDLSHYMVYERKERTHETDDFQCTVENEAHVKIDDDGPATENADDGLLRNYRLVVSTNGEYTNYFGGTVAQALAAINTTMTRVNGLFETDFNVTMTLISSTTSVIYTNPSTDPYSNNSGPWNGQLQNTLTSVIGEANYDIGHLFALGGNNGNAGCIGCVCVNGQKGSAFTSRSIPEGDPFDVDYVAHEMGHQFGGNHTWTFNGNEGTNVQMEPGSGSTIMGYAGITGATDVQPNSDPYFHAITIEQITDYIKTTSCQINTNTGNTTPTANAGSNYTIPRGTPFLLTGTGSDSDGDALTYCWEQIDENNASTTYPSVNATSGVAFRSFLPSTSSERSFPALSTVLAGNTATTWEAIPNVGRTLNFRLTVRDNRAGGASNQSDDMVVTVNNATGPFVVNVPNTNVSWSAGSSQTVSWSVAGTSGSPINASTVNILMSTDG
ncbi:MAG: reprolysin-like metallopeptidase, partial [Bacteroidota bacterium]